MSITEAVTTTTSVDLLGSGGGRPLPVRVRLSWQVSDPYTVAVLFETGRARPVVWLLSRELLAEGLTCQAGWGDVRVQPDPGDQAAVLLELRSPTGQARFRVSAWELSEFLDATLALIPLGHEQLWIPLDAELAAVLGAAGAGPA